MSNGLVLPTNKWKYARKLAENVVTWADGQGGAVNGVITAVTGADEWSNVAGRLALFMGRGAWGRPRGPVGGAWDWGGGIYIYIYI